LTERTIWFFRLIIHYGPNFWDEYNKGGIYMKGVSQIGVLAVLVIAVVVGFYGYGQGWFGTGFTIPGDYPAGCDQTVTPNLFCVR
jgi:hypothetical protein